MPKTASAVRTYRFDQMATMINDRVDDPAESGVERYVGLEHLDADSLRIRRWGDITDVESTKLRFKPGDIIFGKRRVYQRKLAVADFEGICSAHAMVLRARSDVVLPEFLPFFMQSDLFMERALAISVGSLSPTINWTDLGAQEFSLPSLEEQKRLSAAMLAVADSLESCIALMRSVEVLRQSYIDHATSVHDASVELGAHCEMQNGRPFPGDGYVADGVRLLRPGNLGVSGYLDWSSEKTKCVPQSYLRDASDFLLHEGDVVINLTAQSLEDGFMGRACLVRSGEEALLNQRIGRFISIGKDLRGEFLFRCLQSTRFKNHAITMCEGSKIKHLFWQHLAPFRLPTLSVTAQDAVCQTAKHIDQTLERVERRRKALWEIRSRMLASMVLPQGGGVE